MEHVCGTCEHVFISHWEYEIQIWFDKTRHKISSYCTKCKVGLISFYFCHINVPVYVANIVHIAGSTQFEPLTSVK